MTTNNSGSMSGMFFHLVQINMLLCSIKLLFLMHLLGLLIANQLFLSSINTLNFTK